MVPWAIALVNQERIGGLATGKIRSIARFRVTFRRHQFVARLAHVLLGSGAASAHGKSPWPRLAQRRASGVRLPSSILNALCSRGRASANARSRNDHGRSSRRLFLSEPLPNGLRTARSPRAKAPIRAALRCPGQDRRNRGRPTAKTV